MPETKKKKKEKKKKKNRTEERRPWSHCTCAVSNVLQIIRSHPLPNSFSQNKMCDVRDVIFIQREREREREREKERERERRRRCGEHILSKWRAITCRILWHHMFARIVIVIVWPFRSGDNNHTMTRIWSYWPAQESRRSLNLRRRIYLRLFL